MKRIYLITTITQNIASHPDSWFRSSAGTRKNTHSACLKKDHSATLFIWCDRRFEYNWLQIQGGVSVSCAPFTSPKIAEEAGKQHTSEKNDQRVPSWVRKIYLNEKDGIAWLATPYCHHFLIKTMFGNYANLLAAYCHFCSPNISS